MLGLQALRCFGHARAQRPRESLAVDQVRDHGLSPSEIRAARAAGAPVTATTFRRSVAPRTTEKSHGGRWKARASSLRSAAFALPPSGAAVTATLSTTPPSASSASPMMRSAEALGVSRTARRTPSAVSEKGCRLAIATSELKRQRDELLLRQPDDQQDHQGRDVEATDVRQEAPKRPIDRLRQAIEDIDDATDHVVGSGEHAEGDQPARDHRDDHDPPIDVEDLDHEPDDRPQEWTHGARCPPRKIAAKLAADPRGCKARAACRGASALDSRRPRRT